MLTVCRSNPSTGFPSATPSTTPGLSNAARLNTMSSGATTAFTVMVGRRSCCTRKLPGTFKRASRSIRIDGNCTIVRKDPGEAHDLAAKNPEKLVELQRLFEQEGRRYNVFPLADLGARNVARSGQIHTAQGQRTVYEYAQPGAVAMSEIASAPTMGRSYTLKATFSAKPSDHGVLVAAGGVEAGYALYVQDGKVRYDNEEFGERLLTLSDNAPISDGDNVVELQWAQETRTEGTMVLRVNGREAARGRMAPRVYGTHGSNELFNIGLDTGAPASRDYQAPFAFTGVIQDVEVILGPRPGESR